MPPRRLPNNTFRKLVFPVDYRQDWDSKKWYIFDKDSVIVADNLTKDDAETFKDSLNHIGGMVMMLASVLQSEHSVVPSPDAGIGSIAMRTNLLYNISELLISLGVIERPKVDPHAGTEVWKQEMLTQLNERKDPEWVNLYHHLKNEGQFDETNE